MNDELIKAMVFIVGLVVFGCVLYAIGAFDWDVNDRDDYR